MYMFTQKEKFQMLATQSPVVNTEHYLCYYLLFFILKYRVIVYLTGMQLAMNGLMTIKQKILLYRSWMEYEFKYISVERVT